MKKLIFLLFINVGLLMPVWGGKNLSYHAVQCGNPNCDKLGQAYIKPRTEQDLRNAAHNENSDVFEFAHEHAACFPGKDFIKIEGLVDDKGRNPHEQISPHIEIHVPKLAEDRYSYIAIQCGNENCNHRVDQIRIPRHLEGALRESALIKGSDLRQFANKHASCFLGTDHIKIEGLIDDEGRDPHEPISPHIEINVPKSLNENR